ncbi:related to Cupin domain protein [Cephalotrichum gorgonifer]|uniref:Related to Cupin domain protein n=1 Tax=Cephalotrichum gorgonifer TaxID=2041049 RepID=A0AAE8N7N5_9PEZI|nr:related to Cupin domain protein [Cephalotrichum gorgonifer]
MALQGKLSFPQRYITTHDSTGKSVLDTSIPSAAPYHVVDDVMDFAQCYVTQGFPTKLSGDADLKTYQEFLANPPGLSVSNGTVLRYVDLAPGGSCVMHRTVSLDFGIVVEGEVELSLDSGETKVMRRGDVCIQRATMHAWSNTSDTDWARLVFVLQPCGKLEVDGGEVKENLGGMEGVRPSS